MEMEKGSQHFWCLKVEEMRGTIKKTEEGIPIKKVESHKRTLCESQLEN